jgi:hypothetical protein
MHDAIPALKAAASGSVAPDDFVRRFVVNGKADEVAGLAGTLRQADPAAWQEARAQVAESLRRAAYGDNLNGDAAFRASAYGDQLRRLGRKKLEAFFSPPEVDDLFRVGRVGAAMRQAPANSAVNASNTASAAVNLLGRVPGVRPFVEAGRNIAATSRDRADVRNALRAVVEPGRKPLNPRQTNYLAWLVNGGLINAGTRIGSPDDE